ncbi:hopene-associated glycosyltransferase HpnB [Novosphingobium sp. PhB165]|uniref:glycosyltransferase n=1 Tax=Novosphingobium sp. PhB165 TaxID=2485105 RepID=UPI001053A180|nr:glycosyltransferase [Novosphingobium sp. PhB165]TCM16055.1 hopene-associated glycosyltransferase HpnB [Novosphingobium sp. PhB165]
MIAPDPATGLGIAVLAIWLGLLLGRDGFWMTRERDDRHLPPPPSQWPDVTAVVPARDEADVMARSLGSLIAQDYPGRFRILLVDDSSSDGTGAVARALGSDRVEVLTGKPLAQGWTGKLWALQQGIEKAGTAPVWLWLTDADIAHAPDTLRTLVTRGEANRLSLVSLMARLRCETFAERMLVPAFVFFFQMLYPFGQVNRPGKLGAAAGGCMLVRRAALEQAGGIGAIRGALIDDCTLGTLLKRQGPVWLGLTDRSVSIRPYEDFASVAAMISRSAYAQLRYSPWLLGATLAGLLLVYGVPPLLALFGHGLADWLGLAAWMAMALSFQPVLRFYRRSPLWGLALPAIAAFYAGCTLLSAWQHARGRGGMWKGRAQAGAKS